MMFLFGMFNCDESLTGVALIGSTFHLTPCRFTGFYKQHDEVYKSRWCTWSRACNAVGPYTKDSVPGPKVF